MQVSEQQLSTFSRTFKQQLNNLELLNIWALRNKNPFFNSRINQLQTSSWTKGHFGPTILGRQSRTREQRWTETFLISRFKWVRRIKVCHPSLTFTDRSTWSAINSGMVPLNTQIDSFAMWLWFVSVIKKFLSIVCVSCGLVAAFYFASGTQEFPTQFDIETDKNTANNPKGLVRCSENVVTGQLFSVSLVHRDFHINSQILSPTLMQKFLKYMIDYCVEMWILVTWFNLIFFLIYCLWKKVFSYLKWTYIYKAFYFQYKLHSGMQM